LRLAWDGVWDGESGLSGVAQALVFREAFGRLQLGLACVFRALRGA
jgi:hypothetical protein